VVNNTVPKVKSNVIADMGEKKMVTCQNASCKKSFNAPLKTLNLQRSPREIYNACPFCLTELKILEKRVESQLENLKSEANLRETKEKSNRNNDNPTKCHFHPGYLSERTSKDNIPDECLVCKDILECMLRKMRE
jgi:hypothetical protein